MGLLSVWGVASPKGGCAIWQLEDTGQGWRKCCLCCIILVDFFLNRYVVWLVITALDILCQSFRSFRPETSQRCWFYTNAHFNMFYPFMKPNKWRNGLNWEGQFKFNQTLLKRMVFSMCEECLLSLSAIIRVHLRVMGAEFYGLLFLSWFGLQSSFLTRFKTWRILPEWKNICATSP